MVSWILPPPHRLYSLLHPRQVVKRRQGPENWPTHLQLVLVNKGGEDVVTVHDTTYYHNLKKEWIFTVAKEGKRTQNVFANPLRARSGTYLVGHPLPGAFLLSILPQLFMKWPISLRKGGTTRCEEVVGR